jgi:hypothetical protein
MTDFPPSKRIWVKVEAVSAGGKVGPDTSDYDIGYKLRNPGDPFLTVTVFPWRIRAPAPDTDRVSPQGTQLHGIPCIPGYMNAKRPGFL